MQWFGVALWSRWPLPTSVSFPEQFGMVEARSAFAAIEMFMRSCGLVYVAYAAADAVDGSLHYRCHKPLVGLADEQEGGQCCRWVSALSLSKLLVGLADEQEGGH